MLKDHSEWEMYKGDVDKKGECQGNGKMTYVTGSHYEGGFMDVARVSLLLPFLTVMHLLFLFNNLKGTPSIVIIFVDMPPSSSTSSKGSLTLEIRSVFAIPSNRTGYKI